MSNVKHIPIGSTLIMLVGPSGSGKSTFAGANFDPAQVVSADALRIEIAGDLRRQDLNDEVFDEFFRRLEFRLANGQNVVADATNIRDADRTHMAKHFRERGYGVVYVVINRSLAAKMNSAGWREAVKDKHGKTLVEQHEMTFVANEKKILSGDNGLADHVIDTRTDQFQVVEQLPRDWDAVLAMIRDRSYKGILAVGDVHGNIQGLNEAITEAKERHLFLVFLGDALDYDPRGIHAVEIIYDLVRTGQAIMIRGNHEKKIAKILKTRRRVRLEMERDPTLPLEQAESQFGFRGNLSDGNAQTINVLKAMPREEQIRWEVKFFSLLALSPDHLVLGNFLFTHGAARPYFWTDTIFRFPSNSEGESFAMFGETTGKYVNGYPERLLNWVDDIEPHHTVVVGHAVISRDLPAVIKSKLGGRAIFLDTGSSKEGHLSWLSLDLTTVKGRDSLHNPIFGHEERFWIAKNHAKLVPVT